jgi:predicted ArsR family transcriptional regulator
MTAAAADATRGSARLCERMLLEALRSTQWRSVGELADDSGLLPVAVRATLRELHARGLVRRSLRTPHAGGWQLTTAGAAEAERWRVDGMLG